MMIKNIVQYEHFVWVDIENPTEEELYSLDLPFHIDRNLLEDALEPGHLPKLEREARYDFLILRAYTAEAKPKGIEVGEISNKIAFFIHEKGLLTIHRANFEFLKNKEAEYEDVDALVLEIANDILMTFEVPLQAQADKMDEMESELFLKGGNHLSIKSLYFEKAKVRLTKKILVITQNVIHQFKVDDKFKTTLQDIKDTLVDMLLRAEEIIDDSNALFNAYMSFSTRKNNEVIKLLTIFSAFFLPLTFIVGVYGMNFRFMPEINWVYGYYFSWVVMVTVSVVIYFWFKRKKIL
jgi:magnesium transporter